MPIHTRASDRTALFFPITADLFYTQFLNGTVDQQTFLNTFTSGGYYSAEPAGTNLTVIGLNTFEFLPVFQWLHFGGSNRRALLVRFDPRFGPGHGQKGVAPDACASRRGYILQLPTPLDSNGHITTATTTMMWDQDYQATFLQILSKYPGLITHTLAAHTHMDEFRIMSPGNVLDITPGITPYFGNNPAFKVFTFSGDTLTATDYTSLNYDLSAMTRHSSTAITLFRQLTACRVF